MKLNSLMIRGEYFDNKCYHNYLLLLLNTATYNQRADNVSSMLNDELSRLMHESPNCLAYSLRMYSAFTVND